MKYKSCEKCAKSVGKVNIIGNILMILIKGYLGVVGRSKGLIADAIHSSADLLATILMVIGMGISEKENNDEYPYGFGKAEYIFSILIYMFLFFVGVFIVYNGIVTIIEGRVIKPCLSAAWGALFSIAINEIMFRQSVCAGNQINSPTMIAKAWESRSDVYSSIAVLIGIVGSKMGFHFMDPLAAIVVGGIILKICIEMVSESVQNLMDKAYNPEKVEDIHNALKKLKDISGVKNVISREMGRYLDFEVELYVPPDITLETGENIKKNAKEAILHFLKRKSNIRIRLFATQVKAYE